MSIVKIIKDSPTLDNQVLPSYFYASCYFVFEENKSNVGIVYNYKAYWFDKKYIERAI